MNKGWKPLPVILKIIFVLLVTRVFLSVFSLSPSFNKGFDFFGYTLYGLYAVNAVFIFKVLLPLAILVFMYQRIRHAWIVAVSYFFIMSLSIFFTLTNTANMLERVLEQMPGMFKIPAGITENDFQKLLVLSLKVSIVFSALFELAILIIFLVKRKYFSEFSEKEKISPEDQLPS
jgi:hypothetical protein